MDAIVKHKMKPFGFMKLLLILQQIKSASSSESNCSTFLLSSPFYNFDTTILMSLQNNFSIFHKSTFFNFLAAKSRTHRRNGKRSLSIYICAWFQDFIWGSRWQFPEHWINVSSDVNLLNFSIKRLFYFSVILSMNLFMDRLFSRNQFMGF